NANREKQDRGQLHQHEGSPQSHHVGKQGDPLVAERRVRGLRKTGKPLLVPGVEPVIGVVGSEKDMKIGVVGGGQGQLHHQQRGVNDQGQQYDRRQRDRTSEIIRFHGIGVLPRIVSSSWIQHASGRFACQFRFEGSSGLKRPLLPISCTASSRSVTNHIL